MSENLENRLKECYAKRKTVEKEIEELETELLKELCPRGKQEIDDCAPVYCSYYNVDKCPFVQAIRNYNKI